MSSTPARLVIVLGLVNTIGPLSIDMYLPAFPEIAERLDTSARQVQLTLTACVAGLALGQLLIGPLSDRLGRRKPLIAAMGVYGVASVLCAVAPSAPALMGLRFVQGLAGAGGVVIARAVVRDLHSGAAAVRLFSLAHARHRPRADPRPARRRPGAQPSRRWRGIFCVLAVLSALIARARDVRPARDAAARAALDHGLRRTLQIMRGAAPRPLVRRPRPRRAASGSARCSPTSPARRSCCRASTASRRSSTACCSR